MSASDADCIFSIMKPRKVRMQWLVNNSNFFCYHGMETKQLNSPNFKFCGAEWNFRLLLMPGFFIPLYLVKHPSQAGVCAKFVLGVKMAHGSVLGTYNYEKYFLKEGDICGEYFGFRSYQLDRAAVAPYNAVEIFCEAEVAEYKSAATDYRNISVNKSVQTLSTNFKELFLSGYQHDIKIKVKDKQFDAHQLVLVARSPVFRAMFQSNTAETKNKEVNIEDCDPNTFHDFLLFVYSGELDVVSPNNAMSLYYTADKYDLEELKKACSQCLAREMSADLIFDVVPFATLHDEPELLKTATEFFVENADEIIEAPKWQTFVLNHFPLANNLLRELSHRYKKQRIN